MTAIVFIANKLKKLPTVNFLQDQIGEDNIAKLEDDSVDIIFDDLILQKIDGRQFFKFVRNKYNGSHFPLVALSGSMIEQLG